MFNMKSLLCILIVGLVISEATEWDGCMIDTTNGYYPLLELRKFPPGPAYSATDNKGNSYYWNFCATLRGLREVNLGCDESAAVCIAKPNGVYKTAGLPIATYEAESSTDYSVIKVKFSDGDVCVHGKNYSTEIQLSCAHGIGFAVKSTTTSADGCQITIVAQSPSACKRYDSNTSTQVTVIPFVLFLFMLCSCGICICACCRNRRAHKNKKMKTEMSNYPGVAYQNLNEGPNNNDNVIQVDQQPAVPHVPLFYPYPYTSPVSFLQPPQEGGVPAPYMQAPHPGMYYYYPNQQPVQYSQPLAPPPSSAVFEIDEVQSTHNGQLEQDERLARELQAKFDKE